MKTTTTTLLCRLMLCLSIMFCSAAGAWAQSGAEEVPIVTFKTSIYDTYGETNAFHFILGAKEATYVDIDCGYGTMEYEVEPATFNSETGAIDGTTVSCKVSPEGIVRIYGDASLIDYFEAEGCYIRTLDISALTNLEILTLSHNELEELDLTPHTKLQALTLNDNPFNVKPLKVGGNKPDLTIINFDIMGDIDQEFNISDYPSLMSFQAWSMQCLKNLDPTGCPLLQRLSIDATGVASLDVTHNPLLKILNISDSRIASIDLSQNPLLTEFYCTHESGTLNTDVKMKTLDLSHNPALMRLACSGNDIEAIDLSRNPALFDLFMNNNNLTAIDLSQNTNLYNVYLRNNNMDFATLPIDPGTWGDYDYSQRNMQVAPAYPVGTVIDLSERVLREGTQTYAELYAYVEASPNDSHLLDASYYNYEDGKVTLLKAYPADSVYLAFGNTAFPDAMLYTTKFKIKTEEEYGKPNNMITMTAGVYDGATVTMAVGVHGATEETPKDIYVDFGDGNLQTVAVTTSGTAAANVSGTKKGSGTVSVLVPDGVMLSAFATDMPLYGIDLSAARSLEALDLSGTGLYTIDLSWNRYLRTLNLSDNNLTTLSLVGVNSLYNKNLLTDINVSGNRLTEIEMADNRGMKHLDISNNLFEELSLTDAVSLQTLNAAGNRLSEINMAYCTPLVTADLSGNRLTNIIFPEEENNIENLNIAGNCFTFATMPDVAGMGLTNFVYAPQADITIPTKGPGYNLSEQALTIDGHTTEFVWKNEAGEVMIPGTDYEIVNGKTTFKNIEMGRVRCEMTNGAYPEMTGDNALKTSYILSAGMPTNVLASFTTPVGGQNVALSFTAAKGSPAIYIDWSGNNDLEQYPLNSYTYTRFAATTHEGAEVKVYTYEDDEAVSVFSVTGATMSSLDASPMKDLIAFTIDGAGLSEMAMPESPGLRELSLPGNTLAEIDLTKYPELTMLALSNNRLKAIDLSRNPKLQMLSVSANEFTELSLNCANLWFLDASSNKLTSVSLEGTPELEQLALGHNELTEIDVDFMTKLRVMYLDNNKFTFAGLPQPKEQYALYTYANQAVVEAEETDGKIDLSAHSSAYGVDTKYTWYLDMPVFDDYGELTGEELYADDEYVIENGVTTFLVPFNNVICVMTNELFPSLYLYTPMISVKATAAVEAVEAHGGCVKVSMNNRTVTVEAPFDGTVALFAADGRMAGRETMANGKAVFADVAPGVYVLKVGNGAYKLMVK